MRNADKTKEQLIEELEALRLRTAELEKLEAERKRAEEELREGEKKYKLLFESTLDGMFVLDAETMKVVLANQAAADIYGFNSVEEAVGIDLLDFVPPEERERVLRITVKDMFENDLRQVNEFRTITKDGREIWISAVGTRTEYQGKLAGLVSFSDITERKRAEEALKLQEAYFHQLFDNSPEGIALLDDADRVVQVNKGFETLFGYQTEEIKGRFINEVVVPEDRIEEASAMSQATFNGEVVHRKETVRKRKDGSLVDVSALGYPIQFGDKLVGVYAVYSDITERKQAEEALRIEKERFQTLVDEFPIGISVINKDGHYQYVNPMFTELFGYSLKDIPTGREWFAKAFPDQEYRNRVISAWIADEEESEHGELRAEVFTVTCKDGSEKVIKFSGVTLGSENQLVTYEDITERKRAEAERRELEQKSHVASRLASVGEMASGIAHEINNPLTAVIGFAQLLMDADLPDDVKEDIGVIHKEAQRAAGVAKNLLTFARRQAPAKELTNLNSIIEGVLELRAYEQRVSNIQVNTRFAPKLPEVMADYSQMQQVFINIILNAETAMLEAHHRGTLTVTTQKVNDSVRASFTDSGPGIAKENLNRIFDPFFTTKEVGKGTGLGLSVCHGIVVEHGGRIYARSKLGNGATFVVELPVNAH